MGHEEIEQQIENLKTELATIEDVFKQLKRAHESDKQKAAWDLSTKTQMALTATMILTMRISGQFDPNQPPPDFSSVIHDLESCWREAKESSEAFLKAVSSIAVNLIKLHDTKVVLWHRSAEMLQNQLKKRLDSSQESLQHEKSQLHTLNLQCMISQKKLGGLQRRSPEAQQKFDDLNKWLWNSPETRLLQQSFKIVIESLKNDIESAKKTAESTSRALAESQIAVAEEEANVRKLASASKAQIDLLTQGVALLDRSTALLEEVKNMQQDVACVKNDRYAAWELVFHCFDQSRNGEITLHKVEYARLVLQIVEVSLRDNSLHLTLASIIKHLAQNDDLEGSVFSITEGHPDGLLKHIQEQLGLPDEEVQKKVPKEVRRDGRRVVVVQEEDQDTLDDDSDSDWDKVTVPFKPYGDFDRSSIRINLNTKDTFPIDQYAPSLQPAGCRVPYGGEEVYHQGDYEVLPYLPELMEFVEAKNGQVPVGRRGVIGGHEDEGKLLYHAIADIKGVWVPGKTGEHISSAPQSPTVTPSTIQRLTSYCAGRSDVASFIERWRRPREPQMNVRNYGKARAMQQ
ncbi:hypothetical protein PT974_12025 [Cladobotryum mycophilum]|uniref:EF-hand domain-containing protein n=1 Tax=Cladobotryum mycophilum TaxID=491253 RepID=A0ABR0S7Y6_9HYPO